jgi:hypothetical protein
MYVTETATMRGLIGYINQVVNCVSLCEFQILDFSASTKTQSQKPGRQRKGELLSDFCSR